MKQAKTLSIEDHILFVMVKLIPLSYSINTSKVCTNNKHLFQYRKLLR